MCSSIVQSMVVVQVLRTDERSHRSYVLATIHVLLYLNNVFIDRLCAFDVLKMTNFHLSSGLSTNGIFICVPELSIFNFVFSFLLKCSLDSQDGISFFWGDCWISAELFPYLAAQTNISVSGRGAGILFLKRLLCSAELFPFSMAGYVGVSVWDDALNASFLPWCLSFTSKMFSSLWDVLIDRILHILIREHSIWDRQLPVK